MRPFRCSALTLSASFALVMLAGCGGGGQTVPSAPILPATVDRQAASIASAVGGFSPQMLGLAPGIHPAYLPGGYRGPGWLSDTAAKSGIKVYVSDISASVVDIYKSTGGAPIGAITSGINEPVGTWVTADGTLYVTNLGANTVTVYPLGKTKPSVTLTGVKAPTSVAVSSTGVVYVATFIGNTVSTFSKGATKPSSTVPLSGPEGIAINAKDTIAVAYTQSNGQGGVELYAANLKNGKDAGISNSAAADVKYDKAGNLLWGDQTSFLIDVFAPGQKSPKSKISTGGNDPFKLCLDEAENLVFFATGGTSVFVYSYPAGVAKSTAFNGLSSAAGVSLSPAAPY